MVASGEVAQLVEHTTENRSVDGSIPPLATILYYQVALPCSGAVPSSPFGDLEVLVVAATRRVKGWPVSNCFAAPNGAAGI